MFHLSKNTIPSSNHYMNLFCSYYHYCHFYCFGSESMNLFTQVTEMFMQDNSMASYKHIVLMECGGCSEVFGMKFSKQEATLKCYLKSNPITDKVQTVCLGTLT